MSRGGSCSTAWTPRRVPGGSGSRRGQGSCTKVPGHRETLVARGVSGRALRVRHRRRRLPRPRPLADGGGGGSVRGGGDGGVRAAATAMTASVASELIRTGHLVRGLRLAPLIVGAVAVGAALALHHGGVPPDPIASAVVCAAAAWGRRHALDEPGIATAPVLLGVPRHGAPEGAPARRAGSAVAGRTPALGGGAGARRRPPRPCDAGSGSWPCYMVPKFSASRAAQRGELAPSVALSPHIYPGQRCTGGSGRRPIVFGARLQSFGWAIQSKHFTRRTRPPGTFPKECT